jgi:hypothetical protein
VAEYSEPILCRLWYKVPHRAHRYIEIYRRGSISDNASHNAERVREKRNYARELQRQPPPIKRYEYGVGLDYKYVAGVCKVYIT